MPNLYRYSRIMMYDDIPDNFENVYTELYLGYGRYVKAKPYNIKYSNTLECYLVEFRYNPKEIYTKE